MGQAWHSWRRGLQEACRVNKPSCAARTVPAAVPSSPQPPNLPTPSMHHPILRVVLVAALGLNAIAARADELPRWDTAITKYNEQAVRDFHPVFDFDSDGCY